MLMFLQKKELEEKAINLRSGVERNPIIVALFLERVASEMETLLEHMRNEE